MYKNNNLLENSLIKRQAYIPKENTIENINHVVLQLLEKMKGEIVWNRLVIYSDRTIMIEMDSKEKEEETNNFGYRRVVSITGISPDDDLKEIVSKVEEEVEKVKGEISEIWTATKFEFYDEKLKGYYSCEKGE